MQTRNIRAERKTTGSNVPELLPNRPFVVYVANGLYDTLASGIAGNPFTTDDNGRVSITAPNGTYDLQVSASDGTFIRYPNETWADITEQSAAAVDAAAASAISEGNAVTAADRAESAAAIALQGRPVLPTTAAALSNGVIGVSGLVGGSGGTDGQFSLGITGGGGSNAVGYFIVAGGVVTSVHIKAAGYNYTSAPALSFAASAGLTGASATAVIGINIAPGYQFLTPSAVDGEAYIIWENVAGVAQDTLKRILDSETIMARLPRQVPPGELLEGGSNPPPFGKVDWATGYYLWWIDEFGIVHDPNADAQLAAIQAAIDASDLTAYKNVVALPGMDALTDPDSGDTDRTDADGTRRIAKLIRGDDPDYMLVVLTTDGVFIYIRVGQPADNYWLRYTWGWAVNSTQDTVQWTDTTLVQRVGNTWEFTELFFWVGGGIQDIVSSEATSGGNSIDTGTAAVAEFIGPGHGYEFKTRELLIYVDGVAVTAKKPARFLAREVHLSYQAHTFRPRTPFDPLTATVLATVDKNWTLSARNQMRARHRITVGAADWTGATYFPLITVPRDRPGYTVVDHGARDWDYAYIALPSGLTSGGGSEPQERNGVREMRYLGPHGGLTIRVGEPLRWSSAGYRRSDGALPLPMDTHAIKGLPDPDLKSYWTIGGTIVSVSGTDYNRFNAGDRIEREFSVFITKN